MRVSAPEPEAVPILCQTVSVQQAGINYSGKQPTVRASQVPWRSRGYRSLRTRDVAVRTLLMVVLDAMSAVWGLCADCSDEMRIVTCTRQPRRGTSLWMM